MGESARVRDTVDLLQQGLTSGARVPLGDLLERREGYEAVLPQGEYRFLGVRWYGKGPFVREVLSGRDVRAKRVFRVRAGDVIYNRLFAWKGSFGVVDEDLHGAVVSNEFPTFVVRADSVLPDYLRLCLEQQSFWSDAEERSTGSTPTSRNRLKEGQFLSMTVAVPDRERQLHAVRQMRLLRQIGERRARIDVLAGALLPAARNEVFSQFT